jgi:2-polyprenyl-6-methoxyphenol hydroxylase-like FAD-dependent oxidoreductase
MSKRILITGASVAGNIIAAVLADNDFEVVVVERAEAFRDGGRMSMCAESGARCFAG